MDPHGDADTVGWICSRSSFGSDIRRCSTILPLAILSTWTAVNVMRFPVGGIPWNAPVWVPWNRPTVTTWSPSATMLSFKYRPSAKIGRHTSELQSPYDLVCRLLLEKKKIHEAIIDS